LESQINLQGKFARGIFAKGEEEEKMGFGVTFTDLFEYHPPEEPPYP
jgi:hypothetical protein